MGKIKLFRSLTNRKIQRHVDKKLLPFINMRKAFTDADDRFLSIKDESLKYIFVNSRYAAVYNKTPEDIFGLYDTDLVDAQTAEIRKKSDLEVINNNEIVVYETNWSDKVSKVEKFPIKLPNGKTGVGTYISDITKECEYQRKQEMVLYRHEILADVFMRSFRSRQEQLDYVLHKALKMTHSEYGYIYYYDEEKREFTLNSWTNGVMDACAVTDPKTIYELDKTGIWGEVVRQRKPIIVNQFAMPNPLKKGFPEGHVILKKFMSIPVIIDEKIVAVFGLANKDTDYDEDDVHELTMLMQITWNAAERRDAQEKLYYERNKYLQTLISIGDGVAVIDKNGNIEMLNHIAEQLTGWTIEEAIGHGYKEVFQLTPDKKDKNFKDTIELAFGSDEIQEFAYNPILTSKDGTNYYLEDSAAPIKDENNTTVGVVMVFRDVTEKLEQLQKIEYLSYHDYLTGLYNRSFFEEELRRLDTERNLPISIIMGDLNGLKLTNDFFGHTYGDSLLITTAKVMRNVCREDDIIARWGGDEFVILLPRTSQDEAKNIMSRIKDQLSNEYVKAIRCSMSMGSDTKIDVSENIMQVLDRAEEKMYFSKTLERAEIRSGAVSTIIKTLHNSSTREKEHSEIVSKLCQHIGRMMNLSVVEIRKLREAGYLHDIGKIVLDPILLNKNENLSPKEINEIQNHPVTGYRILNTFDDTMDLAEFVLAHEECWDGSGYPKGLVGEDIPLLSRIIAIANDYERAINRKSVQEAVSRDEAIAYIRENAGKRFDPVIAEVFAQLLETEKQT